MALTTKMNCVEYWISQYNKLATVVQTYLQANTMSTQLTVTVVTTTMQFPWQLTDSKRECCEPSWSRSDRELAATGPLCQLSLRPARLSFITKAELLDNMPNDDEDDSLALFVTSLIDDSVFWNQVFFDDWASIAVAFSWWSRSWFLHSDSTRASFVCASSSSSSRISWSLSVSSGFSATRLEEAASSPSATVSLVM